MPRTKNKIERDNIYRRSYKGVITNIYHHQKQNSLKRNHTPPSFTKEELKIWLFQNNFEKLHLDWVKSGYERYLHPSVDRLDDNIGYTIDNIQLLTWKENWQKQNNKTKKLVLQYDLDMNLLAEYECASIASSKSGIPKTTIATQCNRNSKSLHNYIWRYK